MLRTWSRHNPGKWLLSGQAAAGFKTVIEATV